MFSDLNTFLKYISNKKIAFIGAGISNLSIINSILKNASKSLDITILNFKEEIELDKNTLKLKQHNVKFILGKHYLDNLNSFDLVFRSPGVYFNKPEIKNATQHGVVVSSEMELFFELCKCKIIAVTGSDGKTTTTSLIAEMLKSQGFNVHLGGNIGKPLFEQIQTIKPSDIAVVELSSFQLISMRKSPQIAVITNISPNHLDIHKNMKEYIQAKENIFTHQGAFDTLILNNENEFCKKMKNKSRTFIKFFSTKNAVQNGTFFDEKTNEIYYSKENKKIKILNINEIALKGMHNVENYLAAISAVFDLVQIPTIVKVAGNFKGIEHRMEQISSKDKINWFNDSIATTPTRTIAGLNCFKKKVILIAGGYDKKVSFDKLADKILEKVKVLILIGATSNKIKASIQNSKNFNNAIIKIKQANTIDEAVSIAKTTAKPGDDVILSPACASFDQFKNFEQRGLKFKELVNKFNN